MTLDDLKMNGSAMVRALNELKGCVYELEQRAQRAERLLDDVVAMCQKEVANHAEEHPYDKILALLKARDWTI